MRVCFLVNNIKLIKIKKTKQERNNLRWISFERRRNQESVLTVQITNYLETECFITLVPVSLGGRSGGDGILFSGGRGGGARVGGPTLAGWAMGESKKPGAATKRKK